MASAYVKTGSENSWGLGSADLISFHKGLGFRVQGSGFRV